ncbi:hypothetical protein BofuT4_uP059210.1 [Botrytis cinerea T4]|uniref:Uncharacterized protein n=1 Tax=Botryotinia fuckeliana (strain T4) TaxID=999810 RepID=G2XV21_BOTF4|nr:hypothetical protein BofuT4_uP059210.1 [Botrytis cinerea T4]
MSRRTISKDPAAIFRIQPIQDSMIQGYKSTWSSLSHSRK